MVPASAAECNMGDKETGQLHTTFNPDSSSFFDMSFDLDREVETESSDASTNSKLFEEIDLSSSSSHNPTDACIHSSIAQAHDAHMDRNQNFHECQQQRQRVAQWHTGSPSQNRLGPNIPIAQPVPIAAAAATQKLVHRFRPEGATISRDDLLTGRPSVIISAASCVFASENTASDPCPTSIGALDAEDPKNAQGEVFAHQQSTQ